MKGKIKKILSGILTAVIGVTVLVGCGSNVDDETVENILKARDALVEAENVSLTRSVSTEVNGESQNYGNDVVVNNVTKEWYFNMFNHIDGEKKPFTEMMVLDSGTYNRTIGESNWNRLEGQENDYIFGVDDIAAINIESGDYEESDKSKDGENTVISIKYTKDAIKKVKEENVKNMEETMEEYKSNPDVPQEAVDSNMVNLEALKATNYKAITHTFIIDKGGVLIGHDYYIEFEQPQVVPTQDGKFELSKEIMEVTMNSNVTINSYNDEKNVEFVEGFKDEIVK